MSEEQIGLWAKAPSETEDQKCLNAISQAMDAVRARFGNSVTFIRQGSHTNRTNIRIDSDVDIAAVHTGFYFPDISALTPADKARYESSRTDGNYTFSQYKAYVEKALRDAFGTAAVERKNKCLRITGNTNRISADVVPAFEHHRFSSYGVVSAKGIGFNPDQGAQVSSFPEQHYANGVAKNTNTQRAFKRTVRILKRTRNHLIDQGALAPDIMFSFFIESLVWNVPNEYFMKSTWREIANSITSKIWNDMRDSAVANNYAEVSDLRWLFRGSPNRNYKQAEDFMLLAWRQLTQ